MLYATAGLRRQEILSLKLDNIDFEKRMVTPNSHKGETKKSWVGFYNEEAEQTLKGYLATKKQSRSERLFPMQRNEVVELWKVARNRTGIDITPQKLRQWVCSEMMRPGVSETYVDAYCGRVPKTVLARHYTDFSPKRLKDIYEKANLDCLISEQQLLQVKRKKRGSFKLLFTVENCLSTQGLQAGQCDNSNQCQRS
jgi:integrase